VGSALAARCEYICDLEKHTVPYMGEKRLSARGEPLRDATLASCAGEERESWWLQRGEGKGEVGWEAGAVNATH
jgi:hypothetical protein